jgi:hypothetical protein
MALVNAALSMNVLQLNRLTELNAIELRPPHMDDSGRTKYPVLFRVYVHKISHFTYSSVDDTYQIWWTGLAASKSKVLRGLALLSRVLVEVYCRYGRWTWNGIQGSCAAEPGQGPAWLLGDERPDTGCQVC